MPDGDTLHGLLPLVRDETTGEIRFVRPSDGALRADVADLPHARLEIVAFPDWRMLEAWTSAVREFGGNHVSVRTPDIVRPRFALLSRFDADPHPGSTVEEVVPLRHPAGREKEEELAGDVARARRIVDEAFRDEQSRGSISRTWAGEIAVLRTMPGVETKVHAGHAGPRIRVPVPDGKAFEEDAWDLIRDGEGYRAVMSGRTLWSDPDRIDEDMRSQMDRSLAEAGIGRTGKDFRVSLARIDAGGVATLGKASRLVNDALERIEREWNHRGVVRSLRSNTDLMRFLQDVASGVPVVSSGFPIAQIVHFSPRRGVYEPNSFVLRKARESGCLETVGAIAVPDGAVEIHVLSAFGRALLSSEQEAFQLRPVRRGEIAPSHGLPLDDLVDSLPTPSSGIEWIEPALEKIETGRDPPQTARDVASIVVRRLLSRNHDAGVRP